MKSILIRNLPESTLEKLKLQARRHHRSLQRELHAVLEGEVALTQPPVEIKTVRTDGLQNWSCESIYADPLNVPDPTYRLFQAESERRDRPASELIREAMEEYARTRFSPRLSLAELQPVSLGKPKVPIDWSEDVFGEMGS